MAHAHRAALVLTKSVAPITKSNVPTVNALTQLRQHAQLLHAQLKGLLSALTDNALLLSPTVLQLLQRLTLPTALEILQETSFLALMAHVLLLLNNADLSYLAKTSSSDVMTVHADQLPTNAHKSALAHHQEASDAHLAPAYQP